MLPAIRNRVGPRAWRVLTRALACATSACLACAISACQQLTWLGASCSGGSADLEAAAPRRLHVKVELTRGGQPQRHEVVVRVDPGHIVAVGLTPMGTQAFRISHDRDGLDVDNRVGRFLDYRPELVYDAIARAYLAGGAGAARAEQGARVTREEGSARVESDRCGYVARLVVVTDGPIEPRRPQA
jgi:hypothetical protein